MRSRSLQCRSAAPFATATLALALACGGGGGGEVGDDGPPFVVSGTMTVAASSAADGDTNDSFASFESNDAPADAQEIPNPVTLGGHLNLAGAAAEPGPPTGRTEALGDLEDWFRVRIAAGQMLRLAIAEDGDDNNLDLEVLNDDLSVAVPRITGTARSEQVEIADTGTYLVRLIAEQGFSNYTLSVGEPDVPASVEAPEPLAEFVPGQLIVRYRESEPVVARAAGAGMRVTARLGRDRRLLDFRAPGEREAALRAMGLDAEPPRKRLFRGLGGASDAAAPGEDEALREDTLRLRDALRARPEVRSADLNYVRRPTATPTDEFFGLQWHYPQINMPEAWDLVSVDPSDVVVAVVDTGVVQGHPDLAPQLVPGFDFISDAGRARDGDGCDSDPEDEGDFAAGARSSWHGTHVAGTVAAATSLQSGGDDEGVAGVAWNARILPLRVLGVGGGTDADIMRALAYAAGRAVDGCAAAVASPRARVVNMSLGGPGFSQAFQDLIAELRAEKDMIFVAAAGNDASTQPSYPAAYAGVISVSAVGPTRALAPYSNRGPTIDVAAPGGDFSRDEDGDGFPDGVLSTLYDEFEDAFVYAFYQGTSMAAPHVAGVVALMLGESPGLTPGLLDTWLELGLITEDIGPASSFGAGLIDAARAVDQTQGGAGLGAVLRVDPDSLNFGLLATQLALTAGNGGDDSELLTVTDVVVETGPGDGDWLAVAPDGVDAEGLGSYRLSVDRAELPDDGIYTGSVRFESDAGDVSVPIIVQRGDIAALADPSAGHHFVLLIDPDAPDDDQVVDVVESDPVDGVYAFRFEGVEPGEYLVVAGTDADFDRFICDPGEACGAFPTTETPQRIVVDRDRQISFVTGFSKSLGASTTAASPRSRQGLSRIPGRR